MTATPRQLSDAIQADYDDIVDGHADESRSINRWATVRSTAGWAVVVILVGMFTALLASLAVGSLLGFLAACLTFFGMPFLLIPALIMWAVATATVAQLEAKRRERMFALYGITIDHSVEPPVYSVGTLPVSWLKPEMHRTRALLAGDASDTDHVAADS